MLLAVELPVGERRGEKERKEERVGGKKIERKERKQLLYSLLVGRCEVSNI